jgi:hypothetical protein
MRRTTHPTTTHPNVSSIALIGHQRRAPEATTNVSATTETTSPEPSIASPPPAAIHSNSKMKPDYTSPLSALPHFCNCWEDFIIHSLLVPSHPCIRCTSEQYIKITTCATVEYLLHCLLLNPCELDRYPQFSSTHHRFCPIRYNELLGLRLEVCGLGGTGWKVRWRRFDLISNLEGLLSKYISDGSGENGREGKRKRK